MYVCGVGDACNVYTEFSFITFHLFAIVIKVGQWNVQVYKRKFVNTTLNVFHFISSVCWGYLCNLVAVEMEKFIFVTLFSGNAR